MTLHVAHTEQLNVRINKQLKEEFISFVIEVEGSKSHYMGKHVENALREYLDNDRLARMEADIEEIRALLEAGEGGPSREQRGEEKNKSAPQKQSESSEAYNPDTFSGTLTKSQLQELMKRRDDPDLEIDPEHVDPTTVWNRADLYVAVCRGILRYAHTYGPSAVLDREAVDEVVKEYCGATPHYVETYVPVILEGFYNLDVEDDVFGSETYSATQEGFANMVQSRINTFATDIKHRIVSTPDPNEGKDAVMKDYDLLTQLEKPAKRAAVEGTYRRTVEEVDKLIDRWESESLNADRVREVIDKLVAEGELSEDEATAKVGKWKDAGFTARGLATEEEIKQCYDVLGLSSDASDDEVQARFRELVMEVHPDQSEEADAANQVDEITKARDVILGN